MQGKFGKHSWKIKILNMILMFITGVAIIVLAIVGVSFMKERRAAKFEAEEAKKAQEVVVTETPFEEEEAVSEQEAEQTEDETASEQEAVQAEVDAKESKEVVEASEPEVIPAEPVTMNAVNSVSATSALSEYDMTHSPDRIRDGDLSTAWVEGVSGQGENESVVFMLDNTYRVTGFRINAGYQKNEDLYTKNSRPQSIEVTFSNGQSEIFELQDVLNAQNFDLQAPVDTSSVTVKILSVYGGWKYTDTAISEISFY